MIDELEAVLLGDFLLASLDGFIEEFDDLAALQAHHMIVVLFLGKLEDRMTPVEIVTNHQSGGLELGQHAIDGGQAHVFTRFQQGLVDILGTHVVLLGRTFENLQDLDTRQGHFKTGLAQFMVLVGHGRSSQYRVGSVMIDRNHDSEEQAQMQKLTRIITLSLTLLMISGCSYFSVYKRDLPQGNLVTKDMIEQLRPGMSRQQVVDLMGSPLLEAPFDANEWDYVYRLDEAYDGVVQRRVTLTFAGNRVANVEREGDIADDVRLPQDQGVGPSVEGSPNLQEAPIDNVTPDRP